MRRFGIGFVVVGAAVAACVVWAQEHEASTCPTTVDFHGVSYTPAETSEEITSADELGTGEEHGCGWKGPYGHSIAMNSIPGVDPGLAIASPVSAYTVYLAPGVKPLDLPETLRNVTLCSSSDRFGVGLILNP